MEDDNTIQKNTKLDTYSSATELRQLLIQRTSEILLSRTWTDNGIFNINFKTRNYNVFKQLMTTNKKHDL